MGLTHRARLWVCHQCEMIGSEADAERHIELKGHRVDQLDQEASDAVREEQAHARIERAAAFLSWARSPFGAVEVDYDSRRGVPLSDQRNYVLWICDRCGDHAEVEPGGECEVCCHGTIRAVEVVPKAERDHCVIACECGTQDACLFVRQRDEARAQRDHLRKGLRHIASIKVYDAFTVGYLVASAQRWLDSAALDEQRLPEEER